MKRKCAFLLCILAPIFVFTTGCSSSGEPVDTLAQLIPLSNEVAGWEEDLDAERNIPGPQTANCIIREEGDTEDCADDWINGAINDFVATGGWVAIGREAYKKDTWKLDLHINEMTTPATNQEVYDAFSTKLQWTDITLSAGETAARIGSTPSYWETHATKGNYFVELILIPECEDGCEDAVKEFTAAVLNKIP
jgi:hypothetical protein